MDFICPEDISCKIPLKSSLFLLARFPNVLLTPIGEIQQKGRASGRSVSELYSRQPSLGKFLTNKRAKILSNPLMKLFKDKANPMDVVVDLISFPSIHKSFLRINPILWMLWLILSPSPLYIKACSFAFDKLVGVGVIVIVPAEGELYFQKSKRLLQEPSLHS